MTFDGTLFDFDAGEIYAFHKVCDTFHIQYSDEVLSLYQRINLPNWKAYERGEITPAALAIARFRDFLVAVGKDGDPVLMCQLYQTSSVKTALLFTMPFVYAAFYMKEDISFPSLQMDEAPLSTADYPTLN